MVEIIRFSYILDEYLLKRNSNSSFERIEKVNFNLIAYV